ncbi:hypothetical protein [Deinococcus misasensis]|nr:hypothetical protein [Deinococcus misasensis]
MIITIKDKHLTGRLGTIQMVFVLAALTKGIEVRISLNSPMKTLK